MRSRNRGSSSTSRRIALASALAAAFASAASIVFAPGMRLQAQERAQFEEQLEQTQQDLEGRLGELRASIDSFPDAYFVQGLALGPLQDSLEAWNERLLDAPADRIGDVEILLRDIDDASSSARASIQNLLRGWPSAAEPAEERLEDVRTVIASLGVPLIDELLELEGTLDDLSQEPADYASRARFASGSARRLIRRFSGQQVTRVDQQDLAVLRGHAAHVNNLIEAIDGLVEEQGQLRARLDAMRAEEPGEEEDVPGEGADRPIVEDPDQAAQQDTLRTEGPQEAGPTETDVLGPVEPTAEDVPTRAGPQVSQEEVDEDFPGPVAPRTTPVDTPKVTPADADSAGSVGLLDRLRTGATRLAQIALFVTLALVAVWVAVTTARRRRSRPAPVGISKAGNLVQLESGHLVLTNAQNPGGREEQQDAFRFSLPDFPDLTGKVGIVAVVADGMGGLELGSTVSRRATRSFIESFANQVNEGRDLGEALDIAIESANADVNLVSEAHGGTAAGTTLAAAVVGDDGFSWIAAGDTRIYLLRRGQLTQVNVDHNAIRKAAQQGEAPGAQGGRNVITSFLGHGGIEEVDRSLRPVPLMDADRILICSDGAYQDLEPAHLAEVASRGDEVDVTGILAAALALGRPNQDNLTAVGIAYSANGGRPRE